MTFSAALDGLKRGLKMARDKEGWTNHGRYIVKHEDEPRLLSFRHSHEDEPEFYQYVPTPEDLFANDWYLVVD